jgi:cytochrome c biogenesis protein
MVQLIIKRVWRFIVRMDVASILILVVLVLVALGSFFPQRGFEAGPDPASLARWEAGLHARYGELTSLLSTLQVFKFFHTPIFILLLALLGVITLLCTLNRWGSLWRQAFRREVGCSEGTFISAPLSARLDLNNGLVHTSPGTAAGAGFTQIFAILQDSLERGGFKAQKEQVGETLYLRADRYRLAVLGTLISHLGVVLLLAGVAVSSFFGWREAFTINPGLPATPQNMKGLEVYLEEFFIDRYPDGSAASYDARVSLKRTGEVANNGSIRVNEPLVYEGVGFYLKSFSTGQDGDTLTLQAVYDPGYEVVVAAGFLLLVGLAITFNFPYSCVRIRLGPQGEAWLAGSTNLKTTEFEREFAEIVADVKEGATRLGKQEQAG